MNIQRIAKNTIFLFIAQIVTYILTFFYTIYIARYLGAEGFGILSFAIAFAGILSIFTDLGLSTLTFREVSRCKSLESKYLGNVALIKIILAIVIFGIAALILNIVGYPKDIVNIVYIILLSTILFGIAGMFNSIFQAHEKIKYVSVGLILNSILMFFGVLFALYHTYDVIGLAFIYLFANGVFLVYSIIICFWKFFVPKIEFDIDFWKLTLKESLPFGLTGISAMIYTYIDSVMLSLIQGNEVVGLYNAAYKLIIVLMYIPDVINITIFPSMSKFYISSQDSLRIIKEKYFKLMVITGIPMGAAITILADQIIILVFGTGYSSSIIALQILVWTIVFAFGGAAFIRLLEATNKQIVVTKISFICVIFNILLNLVLIPKFSYIGASISTVLTEIILVGGAIGMSYKLGYGIPFKRVIVDLLKIIFATLIMSIFIFYFKGLNLLISLILAALIYLVILYLVNGIDNEDIYLFKQLLRYKNY